MYLSIRCTRVVNIIAPNSIAVADLSFDGLKAERCSAAQQRRGRLRLSVRMEDFRHENDSFDLKSKIQVFVLGVAGGAKKIERGFGRNSRLRRFLI
jgi:hypothetical protein